MKITERIVDRRVTPTNLCGGEMVRRERKGVMAGPFVVARENSDTPYAQDGFVSGGVHTFLVHLGTGYRGEIQDKDVLFEINAEIILRD